MNWLKKIQDGFLWVLAFWIVAVLQIAKIFCELSYTLLDLWVMLWSVVFMINHKPFITAHPFISLLLFVVFWYCYMQFVSRLLYPKVLNWIKQIVA